MYKIFIKYLFYSAIAVIKNKQRCKVRAMRNYSTSFFSLNYTCLDAVFDADYEPDLIFLFNSSICGENFELIRGF